ncbi:hypothetical protein PG997_007632 [Apiospora hydei]|uniref:RING-type domain-containing protein n=1 Tax=Apiospora hydei TaxID=1337664 RepID=A0ABR1W8K5_9PEZI
MFLPTFLNPSGSRSSSHKSKSSKSSPETTPVRSRSPDPSLADYLYDESQLEPPPPLPKDLLDLNTCLEILATIFPDVQVEVFREMLASFSEESRLEVIADAMLKNPAAWVKGRRRLRGGQKEGEAAIYEPPVPPAEAFRGSDYRNAVRSLAWQEFKGLSKSAIDAVLSESNYSYLDARPTLVNLSSKSWKFTISSMLFRRKPVTTGEAENHPLVVWKSSGQGYIVPTIKPTGNAELDKELFNELIVPLKKREASTREESDRTLAMTLHTEEAEAAEATYECACCFTEATFEEFTTCNTSEGHMICFRCVQHSITEAIFGQGWHRSINKDAGTLHCPAVASQECKGCISAQHIHRAMLQERNGAEVLRKFDQRLADHDLLSSNLPLIRCPFCNYAEVDDLYVPESAQKRMRLRVNNLPNLIFLVVITLCVFPVSVPLIMITTVAVFFLSSIGVARNYAIGAVTDSNSYAVTRSVGQASCMSCSKGWVDIHVCHESELVALRTAVEQAMSLAVKRVCPRCYTSFVKSAGCNKLTCPCGYKMCYVCRADIGASNQGYSHFCQHFRPEGDGRKCLECRKCNLWEAEDQEAILRQAREDTERKWRDENRDISAAERAYLDTGVASGGAGKTMHKVLTTGRLPSVNDVFDFFVETFLVV